MHIRCKRFLQGFPQGEPPGGNPAKHKILWSPRLRTIAGIGFRGRLESGRRNTPRITPFRLSNHWGIPIHSVSLGVSPGGNPPRFEPRNFPIGFPRGFPRGFGRVFLRGFLRGNPLEDCDRHLIAPSFYTGVSSGVSLGVSSGAGLGNL